MCSMACTGRQGEEIRNLEWQWLIILNLRLKGIFFPSKKRGPASHACIAWGWHNSSIKKPQFLRLQTLDFKGRKKESGQKKKIYCGLYSEHGGYKQEVISFILYNNKYTCSVNANACDEISINHNTILHPENMKGQHHDNSKNTLRYDPDWQWDRYPWSDASHYAYLTHSPVWAHNSLQQSLYSSDLQLSLIAALVEWKECSPDK